MIQARKWLPVSAPNPPTNPPIIAVTRINKNPFGREKIPATRLVRMDSVNISILDASMNQSNPIPRKPERKDENPLDEIIKLIRKLAIATDHHGNIP